MLPNKLYPAASNAKSLRERTELYRGGPSQFICTTHTLILSR